MKREKNGIMIIAENKRIDLFFSKDSQESDKIEFFETEEEFFKATEKWIKELGL